MVCTNRWLSDSYKRTCNIHLGLDFLLKIMIDGKVLNVTSDFVMPTMHSIWEPHNVTGSSISAWFICDKRRGINSA